MKYSNPRLVAEFDSWPMGGNKRGKCRFFVEGHPTKGYRVGRITINPDTGLPNKTKYSIFAGKAAIVDGPNGRTYILQVAPMYSFVKVMTHDFMSAGSGENFFDDPERSEAIELINQAE